MVISFYRLGKVFLFGYNLKNKKLYVLDNGISNAIIRIPVIDDTREGQLIESICARDALAACEGNLWSLSYWREKGAEVDLIIPLQELSRANIRPGPR